MALWSFTLRLNRVPRADELDALYEAGLDDSTPEGDLLHLDLEAGEMVDAAWSAARQVATVRGLYAMRLERDDAVTLRDLAQRLGRTYESVRLLAEGSRGPGGFPAPLLDTTGGRIWSWHDVAAWLAMHYPDAGVESGRHELEFRRADAVIRLAASYAEASERDRQWIDTVLRQVAAA